MLADNRREKLPTRSRAYTRRVLIQELSFQTLNEYRGWRRRARQIARQVLDNGDFLIWITGNHLGSLPVLEEFGSQSDDNLVIQLDAHLDIYNLTDSKGELSHGNFLLHAQEPLPRLINVGNRELILNANHVAKYYSQTHSSASFACQAELTLENLRSASGAAESLFLDIDCDVFDPGWFPAVTHPMPFGLSSEQVLRILDAAWTDRLAGLCLSEFDPARDSRDRCLATLLWLLEFILLRLYE
jgi:arginase family enzyme